MKFTETHTDGGQLSSGIVTDDAVGTACLATGAVVGGVWSIGSHIHTLVAAPLLSLTACGGSAVLAGVGAYRLGKREIDASEQTVSATATAVA